MKTLISIDPGLSTGLIVGTYSDTEPFRVTHAFQIEGGVDQFHNQVHFDSRENSADGKEYFQVDPPEFKSLRQFSRDGYAHFSGLPMVFLAEKFNARGGANSGFSYTTASLEPLRVEGSIITKDLPVTWVQPAQQYFMGGESKAEKLKSRNAWFKEHADLGYYLTGKSVGQKDADDARSALAHCISWLRREKHLPTLSLFRRE